MFKKLEPNNMNEKLLPIYWQTCHSKRSQQKHFSWFSDLWKQKSEGKKESKQGKEKSLPVMLLEFPFKGALLAKSRIKWSWLQVVHSSVATKCHCNQSESL